MRTGYGALCGAIALFASSAAHTAGDNARTREGAERVKTALEAAATGDCSTALKRARPVADKPQQFSLPDELTAIAYHIAAACELERGDSKSGHAYALAGTALDASPDETWHIRLAAELDSKNWDAAIATIEAMTRGRGRALNSVPIRWLWSLSTDLKASGRADLTARLLTILGGGTYIPAEPFVSSDIFRLRYARLLGPADAGRAAELLGEITDPLILAEASVDKNLRDALPRDLDLRRVAEQRLELDRAAMKQHPSLLDGVLRVSGDLRMLGRPQEALDLLDTVSARINDESAFDDLAERRSWWWDERARNYTALGRPDEAMDSLRKGGALNVDGMLNVRQIINLAYAQLHFGQGAAALETLAAFDDPARKGSPFGEMEMRTARACARIVTGQADKAPADLTYATEHESDNPEALGRLMLCKGDLDGAAASFIRRLDDPDQRAETLLLLSDYDAPPVALPPDPTEHDLPALKARPDVKAAIERAGGTRRIPLQKLEF